MSLSGRCILTWVNFFTCARERWKCPGCMEGLFIIHEEIYQGRCGA